MPYTIITTETFFHDFLRLPLKVSKKFPKKIRILSQDPISARKDAKKIGEKLYRARVGDYRIIYCVSKEFVKLLRIGKRSSIYKSLNIKPGNPISSNLKLNEEAFSEYPGEAALELEENYKSELYHWSKNAGYRKVKLSNDFLEKCGVNSEYWDLCMQVENEDELIDLQIPDNQKERLLDGIYPPVIQNLDETIQSPGQVLENPQIDLTRVVELPLGRKLRWLSDCSRNLLNPVTVEGYLKRDEEMSLSGDIELSYSGNLEMPLKGEPSTLLLHQAGRKLEKIESKTIVNQTQRSIESRKRIYGRILLFLMGVVVGSVLWKTVQYRGRYPVSQDSLVIGAVNSTSNYDSLKSYLERSLVPSSFFQYLLGKKIAIDVVAGMPDLALPYPEAISAIKSRSWDVVFSYSPIIGMSAVDSGYKGVAVMFPGSSSYQSSFFVKKTSGIKDFEKIDQSHTVALGDFFSASKFLMPAYELYGKQLNVRPNVPSKRIFELVRSGEVDIGVGVINELPSDLRIIKQSRSIPGAGVYVSPELSVKDNQSIKLALINAPDSIKGQESANYDVAEQPNYEYFREIVKRVRNITACSDFSQSQVQFFCSPELEIVEITGRVNGIESFEGNYNLLVYGENRDVCRLQASATLLREVLRFQNVFDVNGQYVEVVVANPTGKVCTSTQPVKIYQPNQISISKLPFS